MSSTRRIVGGVAVLAAVALALAGCSSAGGAQNQPAAPGGAVVFNDLGGGRPVLTGPSIVDRTDIEQILPYTADNKR